MYVRARACVLRGDGKRGVRVRRDENNRDEPGLRF